MIERLMLIALMWVATAIERPLLAQDTSADDEQGTEIEAAEKATEGRGEEEAPPTDDESYLDIDEEDFTPSEEIPADQSIAFPTDI